MVKRHDGYGGGKKKYLQSGGGLVGRARQGGMEEGREISSVSCAGGEDADKDLIDGRMVVVFIPKKNLRGAKKHWQTVESPSLAREHTIRAWLQACVSTRPKRERGATQLPRWLIIVF